MRNSRKVSKEEFIDFLDSYPKELAMDICYVFDPPVVTYNDKSLGHWPDSVVAWFLIEDEIEYLVKEGEQDGGY